MKIVIVGGVAGGMSAATRLRRLKEDAEIVVFEKGPYVSFANCGLPYYLSGEISERENLLVQTPESLAARFQLDVRPNHEVTAVYPDEKKVEVLSDGKKWQESYDVLLLSPGAKPVRPAISGLAEAKNVYTVRNVPDIDMVMNALEEQPKKAVVVGAGFIGLEMAENLKKRGLAVSIVELAPHVLPSLDEEMAVHIQNELIKQGVHVQTKRSVTAFEHGGKQLRLDDGTTIDSDLTILSVGVQPDSTLAKMAGLETGLRGGIVVNEHYQTSDPSIYAVGDAIVVKQQITGADALISLASPANRQGRQAADNIAGIVRNNRGSLGTSIVRVFDLAAASTGLTERMAQQANLPFSVVHVSGKDHASYYPEATDILLKLIFHPKTGEIYGAQGVGAKGVDKRIDSLATAIKGQLTIFDLPELEFTYAPPFGSAKDPVNMVGYAATNIVEGLSDNIQWHELDKKKEEGAFLLDVRDESEVRRSGAIKGFVNIPLNSLRERLSEIPEGREIVVSCASAQRSYMAERLLKQKGYRAVNLSGAFNIYRLVKSEEIEYYV